MSDNRRSTDASKLRLFFDEQLLHLQGLIDGLVRHPGGETSETLEDKRLIEDFVDAANTKIRAVAGFSERLRKYVRPLYDHVLVVADTIPPPVDLSQSAFVSVPLVNSLFVNAKEIGRLFLVDAELRTYCRKNDVTQISELYGLLTACKTEKAMFGVGLQGEMLVRDVPQLAVNFSCHKIHMPCTSLEELKIALRQYLFDRVVSLIRREMSARMTAQFSERGCKSYDYWVKSLANPEVYLDTLIGHIDDPERLLSVAKMHFRLSKLGIKLEKDDRQLANEFDIYELSWSDGSRNILLQVRYSF